MKNIITILALLISSLAFGQTGLTRPQVIKAIDSLIVLRSTPVVAPLYVGTDKRLRLDSALILRITKLELDLKAISTQASYQNSRVNNVEAKVDLFIKILIQYIEAINQIK